MTLSPRAYDSPYQQNKLGATDGDIGGARVDSCIRELQKCDRELGPCSCNG